MELPRRVFPKRQRESALDIAAREPDVGQEPVVEPGEPPCRPPVAPGAPGGARPGQDLCCPEALLPQPLKGKVSHGRILNSGPKLTAGAGLATRFLAQLAEFVERLIVSFLPIAFRDISPSAEDQ